MRIYRSADVLCVSWLSLTFTGYMYLPNVMEIYREIICIVPVLQKEGTKLAVQRRKSELQAIIQQEYSGIMGGSDSFTIIEHPYW